MYHYLNNPRFQWFFDTPNQCAAILAMFAIIAAGFFLFFSVKSRRGSDSAWNKAFIAISVLSFGVCVLSEYFLVKTYSRGGYVAFIAGLLMLFFISRRKRSLYILAAVFLLFIIIPDGTQRTLGIANIADASIGNRIELWKGALAMSADYWQSGVGFGFGGPFLKIYPAWYQPLWMNTFYNTAVCDYLSLSAKGGIFLLFGYLAVTFTILFSGYRLYRKNRNLLLAGLICAQFAYLVSGIFSTFFNIDYVVIPFFVLQTVILVIVLIDFIRPSSGEAFSQWFLILRFSNIRELTVRLLKNNKLSKTVPILAAGGVCVCVLLAGIYFRSQIQTKHEFRQYNGLKVAIVAPRSVEPEGIILYLFDSSRKSLEEEARLTLRPLAEKGFIVISAETEGGFKGLEESRKLRRFAFELAKKQSLPVMFAGQGEGGRFAIIMAAAQPSVKNGQTMLAPFAVVSIGSELEWPFAELSAKNYLNDLKVPLLLIYGTEDRDLISMTEAPAPSINSAGETNGLRKSTSRMLMLHSFPDAPHYLGSKREEALRTITDFFRNNVKESTQQKIRESQVSYIDYAKASRQDIISADGWIFGGRICPRCDYLKAELIPELLNVGHGLCSVQFSTTSLTNKRDKQDACPTLNKENNQDGCPTFICVDLDKPENIMLLMKLEDKLDATGRKTPVLLFNSMLYYGNDAISDFIAYGEKHISGNDSVMDVLTSEDNLDESVILQKRAAGFQLPVILTAGLVDGINPCVFSTLIFFMSLLGVSKIKGKKLLLTGFAYCSACFLTYFFLGFGALHMLKLFTGFSFLRVIINSVTVILLLLCALVSFRDSWVFSRSQDPKNIKLQLPDSVKNKIHRVLRKGLSFRYLIPGALLTGFIVTLLESLCTGQVYVPVLVLLAKENFMSKWLIYLIVYNIMFILPLIAIFCMAFFGVTVSGFLKLSKQNVVLSKLLLGCLFLALTVLIIALG